MKVYWDISAAINAVVSKPGTLAVLYSRRTRRAISS